MTGVERDAEERIADAVVDGVVEVISGGADSYCIVPGDCRREIGRYKLVDVVSSVGVQGLGAICDEACATGQRCPQSAGRGDAKVAENSIQASCSTSLTARRPVVESIKIDPQLTTSPPCDPLMRAISLSVSAMYEGISIQWSG